MSFQAMAWATEQKLATREKFVLIMLANYAGNDQWDCHPSLNTLADVTGMSRDTVMRAIKSLETSGFVKIIRRTVDGINLPNIYRLVRSAGGSVGVRGVVAECDQGSSYAQGGVVAECDSNQSFEPINEPDMSPQDAETPDAADRLPYEAIRKLYNKTLGGKLQRCLGLNDKHRKGIRACYNLKLNGKFLVQEGGMAFWEGLFNDVLDCPFLLGQNDRTWRADFAFLTTATKVQSFLEGKYDR